MINKSKLKKIMRKFNFSPKEDFITVVVEETNKNFTDKAMAAQFLAHLAHESVGFAYIEEIAYAGNNCPSNKYGSDSSFPGKQYYGRGFIQLSYPYNYRETSIDIFGTLLIYENPELVAKDLKIAMAVSIWFWKKKVEPFINGNSGHFGYSTNAINGKMECGEGKYVYRAKKRYQIYVEIAKEMNLEKIADEFGCYKV
ncbi:Endochitinase [Nucleospora cyclopteri]